MLPCEEKVAIIKSESNADKSSYAAENQTKKEITMKQCREMDSPRPRRNSWVLAQSLRGISELLKQKLWELYDNEEAIPQWVVSGRMVSVLCTYLCRYAM